LAPENTRSGPADIGGILKMVIAIRKRLGYSNCRAGSSHQSRGDWLPI